MMLIRRAVGGFPTSFNLGEVMRKISETPGRYELMRLPYLKPMPVRGQIAPRLLKRAIGRGGHRPLLVTLLANGTC